jgi:hypothetical protein
MTSIPPEQRAPAPQPQAPRLKPRRVYRPGAEHPSARSIAASKAKRAAAAKQKPAKPV